MNLAIRAAALVLVIAMYSAVVEADLPPSREATADRHSLGDGGQVRQERAPALSGPAAGKDILQKKCFQCHQPTMWASLKQDRKAWASTLYRMVGRGALWTEDEINAMADFLAETRGPASK